MHTYLHGRPDTSADALNLKRTRRKMGRELDRIPDAFFGWGDLETEEAIREMSRKPLKLDLNGRSPRQR
jgi:hypothetical protein